MRPVERDDWRVGGPKINAPENLEKIRHVLENVGVVIVEHWFYRGARAPDRFFFEEFDDCMAYLGTEVGPGDQVYVWSFSDVCTAANQLAAGKYPDQLGRVPRGGAY